jgi:RimJ/RimL family protein N-acetyltransferase
MSNIFQGKRVRLRAGEPSEDVIFRNWDREDTDSARFLYKIPFPLPRLDAQAAPLREARSHEGDDFPFTIETLMGAVAGAIHIHQSDRRCGTFRYGIAILPEHRGKGYAAEAIWLVLRYYFYERRYQKCAVEVYSFNEVSIRLHERMGFTLEGRLRRMIYAGGEFHDLLYYGIMREEFESVDR